MTHSPSTNPLCALLGIEWPLLSAPMAGVAGGRLAAAVTAAGGLGLIGGGYGEAEWIEREFAETGHERVGVGFITWRLDAEARPLDIALACGPRAVLLSFSAIDPYVPRIRAAGAKVIAQVQSVAQARAAREAGADIIVAQGADAGGHAGQRGTLALVPAVVDAISPVPVVAAGGIADGRGIAAALSLGAAGVMLGTRFYASEEALAHASFKRAALQASGDDTVRSDVFDRLRGWQWPSEYALRTLANEATRVHRAGSPVGVDQQRAFADAMAEGDVDRAAVIVGECVDLCRDLPTAGEIVSRLVAEAAAALAAARASTAVFE